MMERYTSQQRVEIIKIYYRNSESVASTLRALRPIYGRNNRPSRSTIERLVEKFESTGTVQNVPVPVRQRSARSVENIAAAEASVEESPNVSLTRRSQALGISVTSLWRILRNDLGLHPYKIKLTQELKPLDHQKRRMFVNWAEQQLENDSDFYRKIIFSDEAHFWLNGFVNKQNMRYWSDSNPHVLHESSLHPEKITVWCGLWAGGVIGPYFFRDDQDRHVTVNGNRYRSMITEYFWPQLDDMDLEDMWFQQDGATSHTANVTINLLETKFGERVISRNGPVGWPPRSCDLTPLDYFLWGYVKSMVYANKPATIDELRTNIEREIAAVSADLCLKIVKNWVQRLDFCKRARGGHAKEIEFHS